MIVGARRNLRQVGHAQDLPPRAETLEQAADGRRHGAADPDVDLVENQCRRPGRHREHDLDRQRETRQLASGRDPGDRTERLLRMASPP